MTAKGEGTKAAESLPAGLPAAGESGTGSTTQPTRTQKTRTAGLPGAADTTTKRETALPHPTWEGQ